MSEKQRMGGGHYTCFGTWKHENYSSASKQGSMCYFNVLFQCVTSTEMGLFSTIFQIMFFHTDLERK